MDKPSISGRLSRAQNMDDLRTLAKRRLPKFIFDYLDGGADDETTLRRNREIFDRWSLIQRVLVDVSEIDTSTTVLGQKISLPFILSPTGANRLFHTDGELAVARAAAKAGTVSCLSSFGMYSLEEVAESADGSKWFQLYVFKDQDMTAELLERCKASAYEAMILTVDCATHGNRERDLRNGFSVPPKLSPRVLADLMMHPFWSLSYLTHPKYRFASVEHRMKGDASDFASAAVWAAEQLDVSFDWKQAEELVRQWDGPFVIKGLTSVEDAIRAADIGASAISVSSHGGRQLDGAPSPMEVLEEIVQAVGDRVEILVDSGFRRGTDIIKALALGAKACLLGRTYLYGLSAGGEVGVTRSIDILRSELERDMMLMGLPSIADISPACIRRR